MFEEGFDTELDNFNTFRFWKKMVYEKERSKTTASQQQQKT